MKIILPFLFLVSGSLLWAQAEKINQLDGSGHPDGKWIVYLDQNWKVVNDVSNGLYYKYTFYDHGTNIYPMGVCGGKGYKLQRPSGDSTQASNLELLDGEYKWFDAKGNLSSIHVFNKGEYVFCKEFYSSGKLNQHFDYTKGCPDQPHSWTVNVYDQKGNLIQSLPACKDKDGKWPKMRG